MEHVFTAPETLDFKTNFVIYEESFKVEGFIGVLPSDSSIYIVFQGSYDLQNWITSLDLFLDPYTDWQDTCPDCRVHAGY